MVFAGILVPRTTGSPPITVGSSTISAGTAGRFRKATTKDLQFAPSYPKAFVVSNDNPALRELETMRELSAVFLCDAEREVVGHRIVGISHFVGGDYNGARAHLEQALAVDFLPSGSRDSLTACRHG
jgi:hypothetical protein